MIIDISAKCSDLFFMRNEEGKEYEGYVPSFLGEWGDYVSLKINIGNGSNS